MNIVLKDGNHTFVASAKTITLGAPYTALSIGQILSIKNITTNDVLYDSESQRKDAISISGAVITHTHGNTGHADTDLLQVIIDVGGSSTPINTVPGASDAFDDEVITVADSAIGLTSGTYLTATKAEMTLETAQIRVRKDGSDPTTSVGHLVEVGDQIVLNSASDIANFKAIRTGSTSGELTVTYSE